MLLSRRSMLAGLAVASVSPVAGRVQAAEPPPFPVPEDPPQERRDYAEARKHFQTRLLRRGPSPELAPPLGTPAGAMRVLYRSGEQKELELIAWVSEHAPSRELKPAVLFLHGGNATGDGHWQLMKPYVEAGFVVMLPSFRGENGQMGYYSGFYDETSDALAAAEYLENLPGVDRDRLFLAGHSNGGTLALLAAMTRRFRAAVPMSAGVDAWRYFSRYSDDMPFDDRNAEEFVMRSSVCFGHSLKCPTLLLRGTEERPFDRNHQLTIDRARAVGVSIDHRLLPGSHNGMVPGAVAESIRFFRSYGA